VTTVRALLLLALVAAPDAAQPLVHLRDGRVLYGRKVARTGGHVVLQTDFGVLRVPADALAGNRTTARPAEKPPETRTTRTKWLEIVSDLSDERAKLYADQLDGFFDWMIRVYALDVKRVRQDVPYRMRVFRRRDDFKELQARVAPGIEAKGQAFAEGVAGFFSPADMTVYMWDAEGAYGGVHLEVAKHETTHLLNTLLARQIAIRLPTWFEEGSATYFSTFIATPGGAAREPEDHPGAFAQVIGDLDGNHPLKSRALRSVKWANFRGREYAWGWALVRYLRRLHGGKTWPKLLEFLRTIAPTGPVSDSEERRFLDTVGFRKSDAFDEAWHEHLRASKPKGRAPLGTSPEVLAEVAKLEKPDAATARTLARIGVSLARVHEFEAAIVYLRAALRGGIEDPDVPYRLAYALAGEAAATEDAPWPDEAVDALRDAVKLAPLRAAYRFLLGRQLLVRARSVEALREAHAMLGLALVLAGPDDDHVRIEVALLRAANALEPDRPLDETVAAVQSAVPPAAATLRTAESYYLQETEDWDALARVLSKRIEAGEATLEQRAMLAGLYMASDRFDEAEAIYAAMLEGDAKDTTGEALRYWPDRIECLVRMGRKADARVALKRANEALKSADGSHGWIRRRLRRIELD
jgi:tetratricopeptide (TPR) repeat protein